MLAARYLNKFHSVYKFVSMDISFAFLRTYTYRKEFYFNAQTNIKAEYHFQIEEEEKN